LEFGILWSSRLDGNRTTGSKCVGWNKKRSNRNLVGSFAGGIDWNDDVRVGVASVKRDLSFFDSKSVEFTGSETFGLDGSLDLLFKIEETGTGCRSHGNGYWSSQD